MTPWNGPGRMKVCPSSQNKDEVEGAIIKSNVFDDDDMAMIMNSLIEAYRGASNGSYTID